MAKSVKKITHAEVRMYRMGTGDCFVVKFFSGKEKKPKFKMMIDCGTWSGSTNYLNRYIETLKKDVGKHVDLLIVTHEHKDHVHVFQACKDLFVGPTADFTVDQIWMGWTENDGESKVSRWKTEYGDKKKALWDAAKKYDATFNNEDARNAALMQFGGELINNQRDRYCHALTAFTDLHISSVEGDDTPFAARTYVGPLEGMRIVKKELAEDNIEYMKPGMVINNLKGAEGLNFYVLGPPESWSDVKVEGGKKGETYDHNRELAKNEAFAAAIAYHDKKEVPIELLPFDAMYANNVAESRYNKKEDNWRKIDNDWLNSAGLLAMRINSITNNLSLALAIEFEDSGRVMLFPGDAEYGSWNSWHSINWNKTGKDNKHLTEDLLNRTVFYKVAHHMSHNGTAKTKGLDMMKHPDLMAMATLDFGVISPNWKSTMPNRGILRDLIDKTKGRLVIMQDSDLFMDFKGKNPVADAILEARKKLSKAELDLFNKSFVPDDLYYQLTVQG